MSGHNALFSLFMLDGIFRSYLSIISLFSMNAFSSCFHEFSKTGMLNFLQMCQWITPDTLLYLCVMIRCEVRSLCCRWVSSLRVMCDGVFDCHITVHWSSYAGVFMKDGTKS